MMQQGIPLFMANMTMEVSTHTSFLSQCFSKHLEFTFFMPSV